MSNRSSQKSARAIQSLMPRNTRIIKGNFYQVENLDGSYEFVASKDLENMQDEAVAMMCVGHFAAINEEDSEGNGIFGVYETKEEALSDLLGAYQTRF